MEDNYLQGLRDIANMARDAERYRALRECRWDLGGMVVVKDVKDVNLGGLTLTEDRLDSAVDELISIKNSPN